MTDYYISSGGNSTSGWKIPRGGRVCNPPKVKRVAITDIPYRDGEIDLTKADGTVHYENRTMSYTFWKGGFTSEASADAAAQSLAAMLSGIANADLLDTKGGCTYKNATCTGVDIDDSSVTSRTVTATFTASPRKADGTL